MLDRQTDAQTACAGRDGRRSDGRAEDAALEQRSREQFEYGVNVGNSLVGSYLESQHGYYYLALCYGKLGDTANFEMNMEQYRKLSGEE